MINGIFNYAVFLCKNIWLLLYTEIKIEIRFSFRKKVGFGWTLLGDALLGIPT